MANWWNEEDLDKDCFAWMSEWKTAPAHMVAGIHEMYQQLLPTKMYSARETRTSSEQAARCRMCSKGQETVANVLSGCHALVRTKHLARHSAALKILFFRGGKGID